MILIIDDNRVTREAVREALSASGYQVLAADNGREGLQLAYLHPVDLVLLDYHTPTMNGEEIFYALRASGYRGGILFTTGHLGGKAIARRLQQDDSLTGYLRKPFRLDDLLTAVRLCLEAGSG